MRKMNINTVEQGGYSELRYPDEVCFAFNPNYIELDVDWAVQTIVPFDVRVSSPASSYEPVITVTLYGGKGRVYLSGLFQLMFEDVKRFRLIDVTVSAHINSSELAWFSFTTKVMWANIEFGERFFAHGVFKYDKWKPYFERTLVWFKNFPFKVTLLRANEEELQGRYDGGVYDDTLVFWHKAFSAIESVDPENDTILDTTIDSDGCEIIFDKVGCRFLCKEDGEYFTSWTASDDFGATEDYNDDHGIAKTGTEWVKDYVLYYFDIAEEELVALGNYMERQEGLTEITPDVIFPAVTRSATLKLKGEGGRGTSVFDETFDYTFFTSGENNIIIRFIISNKTCGHYLRWIDRFGFYQFYLFAKGNVTTKNKLSGDTIEELGNYGMYFNNWQRNTQVTAEKKIKCCAENLQDSVYNYVETILTSPIIDMYMGKTKSGKEMWMPVNIVASSETKKPHLPLRDLEIEIQLPGIEPQSL